MGEILDSKPEYLARKPSEWDSLLTTVESSIENEGAFGEESTRKTLVAVLTLDTESIEQNRYYGLGLVMCGIARAIHQPEQRAALIDNEAQLIAADHANQEPRRSDSRLHLSEIKRPGIHQVGRIVEAESAMTELPPAEAWLIKSLMLGRGIRRIICDKENGLRPGEVVSQLDTVRLFELGERSTAKLIAQNLLNASYVLTRSAIAYEIGSQQDLTSDEVLKNDPCLFDSLTEDKLKTIAVTRAALVGTGFRIDEFNDSINEQLDYTPETSTLHVRRATLRRPPSPVERDDRGNWKSMHTGRLRCPALHVAGLIPTVVAMVPNILITADQKIMAHNKQLYPDLRQTS